MPPEGFKPATAASDRPQTIALDRSATGIGRNRTRNPSKPATADTRVIPLGHWDLHSLDGKETKLPARERLKKRAS